MKKKQNTFTNFTLFSNSGGRGLLRPVQLTNQSKPSFMLRRFKFWAISWQLETIISKNHEQSLNNTKCIEKLKISANKHKNKKKTVQISIKRASWWGNRLKPILILTLWVTLWACFSKYWWNISCVRSIWTGLEWSIGRNAIKSLLSVGLKPCQLYAELCCRSRHVRIRWSKSWLIITRRVLLLLVPFCFPSQVELDHRWASGTLNTWGCYSVLFRKFLWLSIFSNITHEDFVLILTLIHMLMQII